MYFISLFNKLPRVLFNTSRISQFAPFVPKVNSSSASSDEFAGLTLGSPKVKLFLQKLTDEYEDLSRSDQRSRVGHRRLATLTPLMKLLDTRNETLENLNQLQAEMKNEKDKELLELIKEENKVFKLIKGVINQSYFNATQVIFRFRIPTGNEFNAIDILTYGRGNLFIANL